MAKRTVKAAVPKTRPVNVGMFGGELKSFIVGSESVAAVFRKAGIELSPSDEVLNIDGEKVPATAIVEQGQTYYATKKYTSQ